MVKFWPMKIVSRLVLNLLGELRVNCLRSRVPNMRSLARHYALIPIAAAIILTGCSQPTTPAAKTEAEAPKEAAAPVEPVSAKTALWPMYTQARSWTTDFVILKMEPKELTAFKNENGKAAVWEATFASPSRKEYRVYTYAIAAQAPDIYKGVVVGRAMPWSGETRDVMAIPLSDFNVDSDVAYKTAAADAAVFIKKYPEKKVSTLQLYHAFRFPGPIWYIKWGDQKLGYVAVVNANTGAMVKK